MDLGRRGFRHARVHCILMACPPPVRRRLEQTPLARREHLEEQPGCLGGVAGLPGPMGDFVAGDEGVGVVGAKHPLLCGAHLPIQPQRLGGCAGLRRPVSDVVAGGEGVRVVGAKQDDPARPFRTRLDRRRPPRKQGRSDQSRPVRR
jgi:hypothetical protein